MKHSSSLVLFLIGLIATPVCGQQEGGGLNDVRLHLSSYIIRESASSSIPAFNFQNGIETWTGSEITTTTETRDVVDWAAANSCGNAILQQQASSCFYPELRFYDYLCGGWDGGWCTETYYEWVQIPGCTDALQEQLVQEMEAGTHPCVTDNTETYPLARNDHFLLIKPGVDYTLDITSLSGITLSTALLTPPGYVVFVENASGEFEPQSKTEVDFSTGSNSITFHLRELRSDAPALFGQSSDLHVSDLRWELGLGALGNGDSAGRLVIHEKDLEARIYTREALKFYRPVTAGTGEIEVVKDGSGYLRQIRTPSSFIDLVDTVLDGSDVIQYEVRMYAPLASGATKIGGVYTPLASDLLIKYAIGRSASEDLTDFFVKQLDALDTVLRSDDLDKIANGTSFAGVTLNHWQVITTANSAEHNVSKTKTAFNYDYAPQGTATGLRLQQIQYGQTIRTYDEEGFNYLTETIYRNIPDLGLGSIGELKVFEGRLDSTSGSWDGKGFSYYYNLDVTASESFGQRTLSVDAFGGWTFVSYNGADNSIDYGEESLIIEPGDLPYDPATFNLKFDHDNDPATQEIPVTVDHDNDPITPEIPQWNADLIASNDLARYTSSTRVFDYDGVSNRESSTRRFLNDSGISSLNQLSERVNHPTFGDYGSEKIEVVCSYSPYNFPKATNRRDATFTAKYTPNTANRRLIGKPLFIFRPNKTKTSFGYYEGSYRGISDAFVTLEMNGYRADALVHADTDDASVSNQTHGITSKSHEGITFQRVDAISIAPGQSTKVVTVRDSKGRVRFTEKWARTTGSQWEKIEDIEQTFTKFGQLTQRASNGRITYEANWDGVRKEWEKDEAGVKTTFEYDGIGRVTALIVEGASGVTGIPATRRTNFFYDARDRLVVTEVINGSEKLIDKKLYDAEGYLLAETDSNNLTTEYQYDFVNNGSTFIGLRKTATYPDDTYRETYIKQNGEFWKDVLYASGGTIIEENVYSFADNVSAPSGSNLEATNRKVRVDYRGESGSTSNDPYVERYYDASSLIRFEETPSAIASSPFQKQYEYDSETGQLVAEFETEVASGSTSGSLSLRRIKEYGSMGEVTVHGIDVDEDGVLTNNSSDRLKRSQKRFVLDSGNVWLETTNTVFPLDNDNESFETTTKSQLSGLSTTTISNSTAEDLAGNEIGTTATVDRTANTITSVTDYPDSDTNETAVIQNGLRKSITSKENLTSTFGYDQAGRQILFKDARNISAVTIYESSKDRVEHIVAGITATVGGTEGITALTAQGYATQNAYDSDSGRLVWTKNSDGKFSRFSYNDRGLVEKQWGDAVYPTWNEYDSFGQLEKQHTFGMANTSMSDDFTASEWPSGAGNGDVTTFDYFDSVGLLKSRNDALNRTTSYTYDARGRTLTEISPDGGAGDGPITITRTYFSKTDELKSVDYSGDADLTAALDFEYYRNGALYRVFEDGVERSFRYDFNSGSNNHSDLRLLAENLPSYYTNISSLASNDSGHRQERIHYSYQSSGDMPGRLEAFSIGTAHGSNQYTLGTTHHDTGYDYGIKGRLNEVTLTATRNWTYSYFPGTNQIGGRTLSGTNLTEQRIYEDDRNFLASIEMLQSATSLARFAYRYNDLGNRTDVVQTGELFDSYGDGLVVDYGYNDRMELTHFDTRLGSDTSVLLGNTPLLEGRSFGFGYDAIGNRSTVTHKDVTLGNSAGNQEFIWNANELNQINTRANPDYVHVQGRSVLSSYVTLGFVPDDLKRSKRYYEFFTRAFELRDGTTDAVFATNLDVFSVEPDAWIDPNDGTTILGDLIDHQQREVWLEPAAESFSYDVRGNLKSDSRWDYTWDGANRLRYIETSSTASNAGVPREKFGYRYDYLGRRVAKDVYSWSGAAYEVNPSSATLYYYDGWNLVYEATYSALTYNAGSPVSATFDSEIAYHWGLDWSTSLQGAGGVGGLVGISFRDAGGSAELRYPTFDGNGNVAALLNDSGALTAYYEYGPYGELWRASGADAERNPFRFSTKYFDAESKFYYYGYRYYSPDLGRFISRDPIGESGGLNLYAFVNNNPGNYYDYLGMFFDFGSGIDSVSNFASDLGNNFIQFEVSPNFESGLEGGWGLQVPTFDFGMTYYDLGGFSEFSARTTSSLGSNWRYSQRTLSNGSFKYQFDYDPGVTNFSVGDYVTDASQFTFGGIYIREIAMPEYNLWAAAGEGLAQGAFDVAMSFRRTTEGFGTTAGYLWYEPVDTVLGMHDQITTNLADGYFLIKDTTWSDVGRDIASFGDLYANDTEFRAGITDQFTGAAVGFATGSGFLGKSKPKGDYYSAAFETRLDSSSFPGGSRGRHFQEANDNLLKMMESDSGFAAMMDDIGVDFNRTSTGLAPRAPPADWTWHHAPESGLMQLVPRWQHQPGSIFQNVLHPGGVGGYSIWGKQ